jgi:aspartyl-tRNA synthetase
MIVELGLIHRNGEEIGIVTDDKEFVYNDQDCSNENYFEDIAKYLISTDNTEVVGFIDQLFLNKFTMENNVVAYLRFKSVDIDPSLSMAKKMVEIALSSLSANFIEVIVIKNENELNDFKVIEEAGHISFLLNSGDLSFTQPSGERLQLVGMGSMSNISSERLRMVMDGNALVIGSLFPNIKDLEKEIYKQIQYIPKEINEKETFFTRKKNLRFLGR